ncbi:hypothetical protein RIF29_41682 [Crotalaria pallida]|uniref:DUF676 domain-containing protein n=1 Tax=Crotalaria pallida TaxID=3830 RepID=A0AAN9HSY1_CROPI
MLDAVHEVAIYIHRFHNLDLFEQGWYRIKVTMRWEDGEDTFPGIPARVVQYEAPDVAVDNLCKVWMIDDTDNSFSTPPFRIRYARQDVFLSIMISFYLSFGGHEEISSAVILKFELMHCPTSEIGPEFQNSLDSSFVSVHEYRIPPKALLGLHSYCPIYFDSFHAVLVDTSIHISLLRAKNSKPGLKVPSDSRDYVSTYGEDDVASNKAALLKALLAAHDILLKDLRRISEGINQTIDLNGITFNPDVTKSFRFTPQASVEKAAHFASCLTAESFQPLSWDDMLNSFQSVGNQLLYLWNTFLKFHRENKTKIMEFLRNSWAIDRKTECSIWMVCSKVEMPHQYISNGVQGSPLYRGLRGRSSSTRRSTDDPVQEAIMRAEHHRRGIGQMRINNLSLQDMYLFEYPSRAPIIHVEHLASMCRSSSVNSYFSNLEEKGRYVRENGFRAISKLSGSNLLQNDHVLRVVIFVHGFQGHHLDLRLVRNQWLLIDPKIQFLMSESNEDKTSEDFREMGLRLAQEVISFLKKKMDKASRNGSLKDIKLSFVGHSIGNLIIRSALADSIMEPYLRYLYTYVSIAGPHLGYMYSSNTLFNSGMWLLKKFKGPQCIHQLTFTDDLDLENTFIYNLSKMNTLASFRNVILLSSPQDGYVPYHSARIEMCPAASLDFSKQGKVYSEMLNNCLDQLRTGSEHRVIMRCDVNFETSSYKRGFNSLVGRAAHIEFLECDIFVKFILCSFPDLFIY